MVELADHSRRDFTYAIAQSLAVERVVPKTLLSARVSQSGERVWRTLAGSNPCAPPLAFTKA